jgi:hypothetical protein
MGLGLCPRPDWLNARAARPPGASLFSCGCLLALLRTRDDGQLITHVLSASRVRAGFRASSRGLRRSADPAGSPAAGHILARVDGLRRQWGHPGGPPLGICHDASSRTSQTGLESPSAPLDKTAALMGKGLPTKPALPRSEAQWRFSRPTDTRWLPTPCASLGCG